MFMQIQVQQMFSLFYAIFFGANLAVIASDLNLFDTPTAWAIGAKANNKPFYRLILSIIFLNVLPASVFIFAYNGIQPDVKFDWLRLLIIVFISLTPNYTYRLYYGLLIGIKDCIYLNNGEYDNLNKRDYEARKYLADKRIEPSEIVHEASHKDWFNHFAIPVFWVFPSMALLYNYFLFDNKFPIFISVALFVIISMGLIKFLTK